MNAPAWHAGDTVQRGQVVGLTGDPDLTCESRPHLHLEVRDAPGHFRAYNPVTLIDADWDALALGATGSLGFERTWTTRASGNTSTISPT